MENKDSSSVCDVDSERAKTLSHQTVRLQRIIEDRAKDREIREELRIRETLQRRKKEIEESARIYLRAPIDDILQHGKKKFGYLKRNKRCGGRNKVHWSLPRLPNDIRSHIENRFERNNSGYVWQPIKISKLSLTSPEVNSDAYDRRRAEFNELEHEGMKSDKVSMDCVVKPDGHTHIYESSRKTGNEKSCTSTKTKVASHLSLKSNLHEQQIMILEELRLVLEDDFPKRSTKKRNAKEEDVESGNVSSEDSLELAEMSGTGSTCQSTHEDMSDNFTSGFNSSQNSCLNHERINYLKTALELQVSSSPHERIDDLKTALEIQVSSSPHDGSSASMTCSESDDTITKAKNFADKAVETMPMITCDFIAIDEDENETNLETDSENVSCENNEEPPSRESEEIETEVKSAPKVINAEDANETDQHSSENKTSGEDVELVANMSMTAYDIDGGIQFEGVIMKEKNVVNYSQMDRIEDICKDGDDFGGKTNSPANDDGREFSEGIVGGVPDDDPVDGKMTSRSSSRQSGLLRRPKVSNKMCSSPSGANPSDNDENLNSEAIETGYNSCNNESTNGDDSKETNGPKWNTTKSDSHLPPILCQKCQQDPSECDMILDQRKTLVESLRHLNSRLQATEHGMKLLQIKNAETVMNGNFFRHDEVYELCTLPLLKRTVRQKSAPVSRKNNCYRF